MADSYHIIYNKKTIQRKERRDSDMSNQEKHTWRHKQSPSRWVSQRVPWLRREAPVDPERLKAERIELILAITPAARWLLSGNNLNSA